MKRLIILTILLLLTGCSTKELNNKKDIQTSKDKLREVFEKKFGIKIDKNGRIGEDQKELANLIIKNKFIETIKKLSQDKEIKQEVISISQLTTTDNGITFTQKANFNSLDPKTIKILRLIKEKNLIEIKKILDEGFNLNQVVARFNRTVIYKAIEVNSLDLVKIFVEYGANLNYEDEQDSYLNTPLNYAQSLETNPKEIIDYLLTQKLDLEKNSDCICWGAGNNNFSVVKKSLDMGIDVNYKSKTEGETALFWAVSNNNLEMVKFLLTKGADIHALSRYETNVIEVAEYKKHHNILAYLKSHYPKLKKIEAKVFIDKPYLSKKEMENFRNQKKITIEERREILERVDRLTKRFLSLKSTTKEVHAVMNKLTRQAVLLASINESYFSEKLFKNGLKIVNANFKNNKKALLSIYSNMGSSYIMSTEYAKGIKFTKKAIKLLKNIKNPKLLSASYHYLGFAYRGLGDYSLALQNYQKSLEISEHNRYMRREKESTYRSLADLYAAKGEYSKAIKQSQELLKLARSPYLNYSTHMLMAYSYIKLKNSNEALKYANISFELAKKSWGEDSINMADNYTLLGVIYTDLKEYDKGLEHLKKALKLTQNREGKPLTLATKYQLLSQTFYQMKNYQEAYNFIDEGFKIFRKNINYHFLELNQFHKKSFLFQEKDFFSTLLKSSYALKGKDIKVFNRWLNYKRSIFDIENSLKTLRHTTTDKKNKERIDKLFSTQRKLARISLHTPTDSEKLLQHNKNITKLKEKISEIEILLNKEIQNLNSKPINYQDISTFLKPNELYIDFAKMNDTYFYFTLDKQNNIKFEKFTNEQSREIEEVIRRIREDSGKHFNVKVSQKRYAKLYDLIIRQLNIQTKASLIISPDGLLGLIPFEAFYDKKERKYLVEKVNIRYIPSGKELVKLYQNRTMPKNQDIVVFSEVDFEHKVDNNTKRTIFNDLEPTLAYLKFSKDETKTIQSTFGNEVITFLKDKATEENLLKVDAPKILHLSTHGYFAKNNKTLNPMEKSLIFLSGANESIRQKKGDGLISGLELAGLNLHGTQLVVLSACETGVGTVEESEGVTGLSKAFMKAGANHIVMSLWSVSDRATSKLIQYFYSNIAKGEDYTLALNNAKRSMIKSADNNQSHPYYWSGFVGSGVD